MPPPSLVNQPGPFYAQGISRTGAGFSSGTPARNKSDFSRRGIGEMGLPQDVHRALADAGILTIADLIEQDPATLVGLPGVGRGSLRRARRWLDLNGVDLSQVRIGAPLPELGTKRSVGRNDAAPSPGIAPVPDELRAAPIPTERLPSRISNLLRRHGLTTLGKLHDALATNAALEGMGVGSRQDAIALLPDLYETARRARLEPTEIPVREPLREIVARLRQSNGKPATLDAIAQAAGWTWAETREAAIESRDVVFLEEYVYLPDVAGVAQITTHASPGALGRWLDNAIRTVVSDSEYEVLTLWIGLGRPAIRHGEIARTLSRSRERVRQLRERSLTRIASTPAIAGVISTLSRAVLQNASSVTDEQFVTLFVARHGELLHERLASGFARLALRASLGMRRAQVPR